MQSLNPGANKLNQPRRNEAQLVCMAGRLGVPILSAAINTSACCRTRLAGARRVLAHSSDHRFYVTHLATTASCLHPHTEEKGEWPDGSVLSVSAAKSGATSAKVRHGDVRVVAAKVTSG
jgi:hypothetical protein